jgi:DNA polymerase
VNDSPLVLDARQRAMLDEMGVKVWWPSAPRAGLAAISPPVEDRPARQPPAPAARAEPPQARPVDAPLPQPTPAPARATAAAPAHGAAVLIDAPLRLDKGAGAPTGGWLIVADMPPEADGRHGEAFAGEAGRLLDNMLRALRLLEGVAPVHLMRTHRGVPSGQPASPQPLLQTFSAHAAALAPQVVLAMGPLAAQSLLQSTEPLGRLRGRAAPPAPGHGLGEAPIIATYHPAYLLRNPADKARAWADLCLAAEQLQRPD